MNIHQVGEEDMNLTVVEITNQCASFYIDIKDLLYAYEKMVLDFMEIRNKKQSLMLIEKE